MNQTAIFPIVGSSEGKNLMGKGKRQQIFFVPFTSKKEEKEYKKAYANFLKRKEKQQ